MQIMDIINMLSMVLMTSPVRCRRAWHRLLHHGTLQRLCGHEIRSLSSVESCLCSSRHSCLELHRSTSLFLRGQPKYSFLRRWIHVSYTIQSLYLLPLRWFKYKKRSWHYFLFDLCYYATILNFVYIWFLPQSPVLFVACYCLSHGSLASAVITWRNSLVFHDSDKVTSLFVHIYAPLTFTVIRYVLQTTWLAIQWLTLTLIISHFYPNADERFPALLELPHLKPLRALLLSGAICAFLISVSDVWH